MRVEEALILGRSDLQDRWRNWSDPNIAMFSPDCNEAIESASVVIFIDDKPNAWKSMHIIKNKYAPLIGYV